MQGYRLLRRARTDLVEIATFTAERWGDAQAERYITKLFTAFRRLADLPELRRRDPDHPPYCRALEGRHAVFYRVEDDGQILIVRVLHATMLPELHLSGDEDEDE